MCGGQGGIWELAAPSAQLCYDPKTALNNKAYVKRKKLGLTVGVALGVKVSWEKGTLTTVSLPVHERAASLHWFKSCHLSPERSRLQDTHLHRRGRSSPTCYSRGRVRTAFWCPVLVAGPQKHGGAGRPPGPPEQLALVPTLEGRAGAGRGVEPEQVPGGPSGAARLPSSSHASSEDPWKGHVWACGLVPRFSAGAPAVCCVFRPTLMALCPLTAPPGEGSRACPAPSEGCLRSSLRIRSARCLALPRARGP